MLIMKVSEEIRDIKKNNQGSVLLITLLIMLSIIGTTVGLAFVVINEIQQSRDLDYSMVAYYSAEAAVEQGLYKIRKTDSSIEDLETVGQVIMSNGASWRRQASGNELQIYKALERNDSLTVDYTTRMT